MMAGQPTFQQTFANCPFPEGVLAVLGGYPVQVRVHRGQRAMEVALSGAAVSQEILSQASEALKRDLRPGRSPLRRRRGRRPRPRPPRRRRPWPRKSIRRRGWRPR